MKPLSPDTTPDAQRKEYELLRRLTPEQKLSMAFALTDAMRQRILTDVRHYFRKPMMKKIRRRFIARVLPREAVIRAYGFAPKVEGFQFHEDWHSVREDFRNNAEGVGQFQPRVGAKRQPWVQNTKLVSTLKGLKPRTD